MTSQSTVPENQTHNWFRSGTPWVWLTGAAIGVSLLAMLAVVLMLAWQGGRYLWPQPVWQFTLSSQVAGEPRAMLGEIYARQPLNAPATGTSMEDDAAARYLVKVGMRERYGQSFQTLLSSEIVQRSQPADVMVLKRAHNGVAYGFLAGMLEDDQPLLAEDLPATLQRRIQLVQGFVAKAQRIRLVEMRKINQRVEALRLEEKRKQRTQGLDNQTLAYLQAERNELQRRFDALSGQLITLNQEINRNQVQLRDAEGTLYRIPLKEIEGAWFPNSMSRWEKIRHWGHEMAYLLTRDAPDNANGHLFPAIFGTVLMVVLMSIVVMPLGVVAAIYLNEYAGKNHFTRWVRIAVANLAGVPSIVYGVFGLGFFVYLMGGTLDKLFYADALPNPTFGTPGLLWASLTLALLTLPVVIVATEEGLARIPMSLRHGSLALGATRAETLWHVVLPMAVPAMLTGLILAVARAAGETAPLMLVGVVKSVPVLPVDDIFPYLHLERKFMHLGFQIYDLAFQSADVEAARPLVYLTALLLVVIVVGLNVAAMGLRHVLREKYRALTL